MYSLRTLSIGVFLVLLGVAGFVYILARPRPPLVPLQPEALPFEETQPSPTPRSTPTREEADSSVQRRLLPQSPASVPRLAVQVLSPAMAETFRAPAAVTLKAVAQPANQIARIEFYYSPVEMYGQSFCRSLTKLDTTLKVLTYEGQQLLTRIGESAGAPHSFVWRIDTSGTYSVMAVATYRSGAQQMSPPIVVIVNPNDTYDGEEWKGWRPPYPKDEIVDQVASLLPSPTPTPSCPAITINNLNPSTTAGSLVSFTASVAGGDLYEALNYKWEVVGGEILGGKDTSTITVSTKGVLADTLTVMVEISTFSATCASTASLSVPLIQPRWLDSAAKLFLGEETHALNNLGSELRERGGSRVYIVVYGERNSCLDRTTIKQARILKNYLVDLQGLKPNRIVLVHGGQSADNDEDAYERLAWYPVVLAPGDKPPEKIRKAKPIIACRQRFDTAVVRAVKAPMNRKCPDVEENIGFSTSLDGVPPINVCPYNPRDPQNDQTLVTLKGRVPWGTYGNFPLFRFWTNGGKIFGDGKNSIWDLSAVKLRPGTYTAIGEADDGCDCTSITTTQVDITNFCTPCLTLRRVCSTTSEEENGEQVFAAEVESFATSRTPTYRWETSKGTIIYGQGTPTVTIDTRELAKGTEFLVTVSVDGLQRYCANRLSYRAVAGTSLRCLSVRKFDEYGSITRNRGLARRRRPEENLIPSDDATKPNVHDSETVRSSLPGEKEWIKVAWSPKVKTDDSFAIVVTYDRTTEAVKVSNQAGELNEELKISKVFKLLKDKYGPDYEVLARVRFDSAGIDCSYCKDQYQSLDNEKLEWSCSVSPKRAGTQTFNLELWASGEPRRRDLDRGPKGPEKVWSKNNLKVEVSAPLLTKTSIFASACLCVVLGLGISLRWLRIYRIGDTYNVGQAVAVGRNVHLENTTVNQKSQTNQNKEKDDG